jgi:glyoxalase family protein
MRQLTGMHHVSALSAHISRSHAFYTDVLGLRPLIKTVNQDDPTMYHLFYGDGAGSPGSEMTVFDMPRAAPERRGNHSIALTTFRVAGAAALAYWSERFQALGVEGGEIAERDGRGVLDFEDSVGTLLSLVDDGGAGTAHPWEESPVPVEHQLRGLGYNVLTVPGLGPTERFLTGALGMGHSHTYAQEGASGEETHVFEMGEGDVHAQLHVRVRPDLPRARYGSGAVHHLALRVSDGAPMEEWAARLAELGYVNSGVVERYYFTSVYVREPNHVLVELASDGPGFEVDGPLGMERLKLPPFLEGRREQIESGLKPLH